MCTILANYPAGIPSDTYLNEIRGRLAGSIATSTVPGPAVIGEPNPMTFENAFSKTDSAGNNKGGATVGVISKTMIFTLQCNNTANNLPPAEVHTQVQRGVGGES